MKSSNNAVQVQQQSPFVAALTLAVRNQVRAMRLEGITAMSLGGLRQAVRTPSTSLQGAPLGTNATYYYGEIFSEVCRAPDIRSFLTA